MSYPNLGSVPCTSNLYSDAWQDDINGSMLAPAPLNPVQVTDMYPRDTLKEPMFTNLSNQVNSSCSKYSLNGHKDVLEDNLEGWRMKDISNWTSVEILQWINHQAPILGVCCTELPAEKFINFTGRQLMSMTETNFINIDSKYGSFLYKQLLTLCQPNPPLPTKPHMMSRRLHESKYQYYRPESLKDNSYVPNHMTTPNEDLPKNKKMHKHAPTKKLDPPVKSHKGRPPKSFRRKKKPTVSKVGRLWEFIRDLLKNEEYSPSLIAWENHDEGTFRFVQSDQVARLWGEKKDNEKMNYEKLSRAMRYYYKSRVLEPVLGRRLVYRFGPAATGWRVK